MLDLKVVLAPCFDGPCTIAESPTKEYECWLSVRMFHGE